MKKCLTLLCAALLSVAAWASEVTYTFGSNNYDITAATTTVKGDFEFSFDGDWNVQNAQFRPNKNASMTITSSTVLIKGVVLTASSDTYAFTVDGTTFTDGTNAIGTYDGSAWTDSTGTGKLVITNTTTQRRLKSITITYDESGTQPVEKPAAPTFDPAAGVVAKGTVVTITGAEGTSITYTVDGTDPVESETALTVDGNVATVTVNEDMIIRAVAMDADLNISEEAQAAYTIKSEPAGDYVFYESFDGTEGTGGNDDLWSGQIASSTVVYDNEGWTVENGYGANQCLKLGAGSKLGVAETPAITLEAGKTYTLTFKAGAWLNDKEKTAVNLSATGATLSEESIELAKGAWTDYTVVVTATEAAANIKWEASNASSNRFFLDEVLLVEGGTMPVIVAAPTFDPAAGEVAKGTVVTITGAEGTSITYTVDGTDPVESSTALTVDGNVATVTVNEALTIKAVAMDADLNISKVAEAAYTIAVVTVAAPTFDPAAGVVAKGTVVTITGAEGTSITYTVDGTDPVESETALTVDGNVATVTVNEDMIIRAVAMDADLNISEEAQAAYTIKSEPAGDYVFYESFDGTEGTGGNDDLWSGQIASSTVVYDNEGWTVENGYGANQCLKLGAGSKLGVAETPAITLEAGKTYTLTFKAGAWLNDKEKTAVNLSATGATLSEESIELAKGAWTDYTVVVTATEAAANIKWEASNASSNRFFLDEVLLVEGGTMPVIVAAPTFDPAAGEVAKGTVVTITGAEGTSITYTVDGTDPVESETALTVDGNVATVTVNEALTIKAVAMDADLNISKVAEAAYTIAVVTVAAPTFDPAAGVVAKGTVVTITGAEGTSITYTVDGTDPVESETALTVDGNVATVTVNEELTIKAVAMDADLNISEVAEARYIIKNGDYVFYESFNGTEGTGGNDDLWNGQIASSKVVYDNEGWTVENGYGANQCLKLGAGSKLGVAETPAITLEAGKTYTLTFKAGAWLNDKEKTAVNLSATGATLSEESIELAKGAWTDYTVVVTATEAAANIKWEASNASSNRFFLDEVLLVEGGTMPVTVAAPTFDPAAGEVAKGTVVTITGAEGTSITYTVDGTDPVESETALTVDGNVATVTVNEALTIKAVAMDADLNISKVAEAAYTIAVVTVAAPTFDPAAGVVAKGTVVTITGAEGTSITYTVDGTDPVESETALTVDGNVATVTVNEELTIKAVAMDADLNISEVAEARYIIKNGDYVFYESFNGTEGTGGNDDLWNGQIASSKVVYDNEGWTVENGYGANQCLKLGAGSKLGVAETPAITLEAGKTYTLTFKAGAWLNDKEKTAVNLSATGATLSEESIELAKGAWTDYTVVVTATEAAANIKWEASDASSNRFFLDEVLLVADTEPQYEQGDVNGDGIVSGADVTALYNVLLDDATPGGNADVNGDGIVSGADVTALYNLLLN